MQCSKKQSPCKCTVPFHLVNVKISMQISLKILQSTFVNYILSRVHNYFYCFTTSNSHLSSLYILNPWFTNCFKLTQIVSKITYTWKIYEQFQSNYTNSSKYVFKKDSGGSTRHTVVWNACQFYMKFLCYFHLKVLT